MTPKTEITDEMVERFYRAYERNDWPFFASVEPRIRAGLEAALNPPEPEIKVSEGMLVAARDASQGQFCMGYSGPYFTAIYRAMEAKRLEEQKAQESVGEHRHRRDGDGEIVQSLVGAFRFLPHYRRHRRATDVAQDGAKRYLRIGANCGSMVADERSGRGRRKDDPK